LPDSTLAVPFAVLILQAFMSAIPRELLEAAGCRRGSRVRALLSIRPAVSRNAVNHRRDCRFLFS